MSALGILRYYFNNCITNVIDNYMGIVKKCKSVCWYNFKGQLHNQVNPSFVNYDNNGKLDMVKWHKNGVVHRYKRPATIQYGNTIKYRWYDNDKYHNIDNLFCGIDCDGNGNIKQIWHNLCSEHHVGIISFFFIGESSGGETPIFKNLRKTS